MAVIHKPLGESAIKNVTVLKMRDLYLELAQDMNKLLDNEVLQCPKCGAWLSPSDFYEDDRYATGYYPVCKDCLAKMASNSENGKKGKETLESLKKTLRTMDLPYKQDIYDKAYKSLADSLKTKKYFPVFSTYMTMLKLSEYNQLKYDDGDFPIDGETDENTSIPEEVIQRFGAGLSPADYQFLQREYEDWTQRYECSTKAQEELFQSLAFNKLERAKARKEGKPTKDIEATFTNLMNTANITPKQNKADAFMESQTLGTLIQKWEQTEPVPELEDNLKDVEKIGLMQDIIAAHTCKMVGIDNYYSKNYDKFLEDYTVYRQEYSEDSGDQDIFDTLFKEDAV